MKHSKWLTLLESTVLTFLVSFAPVACLATAFQMDQPPVVISSLFFAQAPYAELSFLAVFCAVASLLFSLCFTLKLGAVPPCILALLTGYFWQEGTLNQSLEAVVRWVSDFYDRAYGFGVLRWTDADLSFVQSTPALCAFAGCIALVCAWTVCRRRRSILTGILSFLPIGACLVVTDCVPAVTYLFLYALGLLILVLSQSTRRKDARQGNLLALYVTLPVILGLVLLFAAIPQDSYQGQARADAILQQLQEWTGLGSTGTGQSAVVDSQENLAGMGVLYNPHTPVMEVTSQRGGKLYLREQGFSGYYGTRWLNNQSIDIKDWMNESSLSTTDTITITTRNLHPLLYVPYYAEATNMGGTDGTTANPDKLRTYTFNRQTLAVNLFESYYTGSRPTVALTLPDTTLEWAEPLAQSIIGKVQTEGFTYRTATERAQRIADYVRDSAAYSRNTGRMPSEQTDFAKWFLEESDTGYCVHFATATAVLLRAAGIPAQYVTGYAVDTVAGEPTTVYRDDAHAWVEYYEHGVGWLVLESTPSDNEPEVIAPTFATSPAPSFTVPQRTEPTETTADTTEPTVRQPDPITGSKAAPKWLKQLLSWLLIVAGIVLIILGQWQLRLRLRRRRMTRGSNNRRALAYWKESVKLSRLLKQQPPAELLELAQKARFSQHRLSRGELILFEQYLSSARQTLRQQPIHKRLLHRILFAAY